MAALVSTAGMMLEAYAAVCFHLTFWHVPLMKLAEHKVVALLPWAKKELADRLAFIGLCLKKAQQCSKANAVLPCLTVSRGNFINLIHTVHNAYTNRMHHRGKDTPLILAGVLPAFPCHPPDNKNRQVSVVPSILPPSVASPSLLSKSIVLRTKLQGWDSSSREQDGGRRSGIRGANSIWKNSPKSTWLTIGHRSLSAWWSFCQDPIFCIIFIGCDDTCFQAPGQCEGRCGAMLYWCCPKSVSRHLMTSHDISWHLMTSHDISSTREQCVDLFGCFYPLSAAHWTIRGALTFWK